VHPWPFGPDRWEAPVPPWEQRLLHALPGPVLDVGCGPGRHLGALATGGPVSLGIDTCPVAVSRVRRRGHAAIQVSVFDQLPAEGRWGAALLLDENLGLGGHPVRLLERVGALLHRTGRIVVEAIPWISGVRVVDVGQPWALVGSDALPDLAADAALDVVATVVRDGRHLVTLAHSCRTGPVPRRWPPVEHDQLA
jgi:SAM-dependent methyltransferase